VLGVLAVGAGTAIEIGTRPRQVPGHPAMTPAERRAHVLDDYARTASGR
jgi:hypothetical protein